MRFKPTKANQQILGAFRWATEGLQLAQMHEANRYLADAFEDLRRIIVVVDYSLEIPVRNGTSTGDLL